MNLQIRRALATDYEDLCALFEEVDALHRDALPWVFQRPEGDIRERDFVNALIADNLAGLFVAQVDDALVGLIHVVLKVPSDFPILVPRRFAVIESVVVAEAYQRRGVGNALMETARAWVQGYGAENIELQVWEFNREAVRFYDALGYETVSRKLNMRLE